MHHYFNGAYGRETEESGDEPSARQIAVADLVEAMDLFLKAASNENMVALGDLNFSSNAVRIANRKGPAQ